jgi:hypothetical protein
MYGAKKKPVKKMAAKKVAKSAKKKTSGKGMYK